VEAKVDSNLMVRKHEVIQTTGSRGWVIMKQMADDAIQQMINKAIDEADETKGEQLRKNAQAARQFWKLFMGHVESIKDLDVANEQDDWYEVACE
jgi:hypothetical protein